MATKKNSFMTQITSAMDKAALGAAAATRLVCDPAKMGGSATAATKENAWPMILLLFPEFCCEPTGAWKEAEEVLVNLLDRYAEIHTTQEHEMKVTVCGDGVNI